MTVRARATTKAGELPSAEKYDFTAFYEREFTRAARFAWLLVRSSAVAEDLVQEAFIALSRQFDQIQDPAAFLHRVLINQARTWQRNERRNTLKLVRAGHSLGPLSPTDTDLFDLVGSLPYRQRLVVVARYWLGWSEVEIAEALGCRPGTVKSLASRAIVRLRKEIENHDRG
jgi:DNA-directed RNA polymerase specialized sigma24 family protein